MIMSSDQPDKMPMTFHAANPGQRAGQIHMPSCQPNNISNNYPYILAQTIQLVISLYFSKN